MLVSSKSKKEYCWKRRSFIFVLMWQLYEIFHWINEVCENENKKQIAVVFPFAVIFCSNV